ncbi:MAG: hypothetical protein ABEI06_08765 [Halobacteriaceae archaeon]
MQIRNLDDSWRHEIRIKHEKLRGTARWFEQNDDKLTIIFALATFIATIFALWLEIFGGIGVLLALGTVLSAKFKVTQEQIL